jgi:hypothetical protein
MSAGALKKIVSASANTPAKTVLEEVAAISHRHKSSHFSPSLAIPHAGSPLPVLQ